MGDQIIYLEKYIDSTTSLPAELNRILNSIKDLDERSDDLAAQIQENVEAALKLPPAHSASTRSKAAGNEHDELAALRAQIESDQRLLIQFAEEKVQLAVQGYDLLEQHLAQADLDIVHLEAVLQEMGMDMAGLSMGGPDYSGGTFEDPAPKRAGSRLRDVPSFDSFEQAQPEAPKPRKTTITLNLSRQISGFEGAAAGGEAQTPGVDSLGLGAAAVPKRPPSTAPRKAPTPVPQPAVQPVEQGYQRNRRAAAAGVHALAAEVSAMEEDDPEEQQHAQHALHVQQQQRGAAQPLQIPHVQVQQVALAPTHGRTSAEVARLFSEREPLIPGLNHASDRPQAPGRLLTYADLNIGLVGRHAEMYWPDDNLWYLIKIQAFDPATRKASILYTTGESEELLLDSVIKEGHMSLIQQ